MAMRRNWLVGAVVLLAVALLAYAWIDGGREPLRPIAQPVAIPGAGK